MRHALGKAAVEGVFSHAQAMRRIGELELAEWQALEDGQQASKREQHSQRTKAGMEEQKICGRPGPKGYTRAGRPQANFDQEKAIAMDAAGSPYGQIALACNVSKSTIQRFFKARNSEPGGAK